MRFSRRTPDARGLAPTGWARAVDDARARGAIDLTITNPTEVELPDEDATRTLVAAALAGWRGGYAPAPLGDDAARAAIAAHLGATGPAVAVADLVLATSTSEAVSWLVAIACEPGDEVLVPTPGYPLFDQLLALAGVRAIRYREVDERDLPIGDRTRAVLAVSPANPTGRVLDDARLARLDRACADADLLLIVDEVFADYAGPTFTSARAARHATTAVLGGLSKARGLPQAKLAWIALAGPPSARRALRDRLEVVADAFLSVTPAIQHAAPAVLAATGPRTDHLRARLAATRAALAAIAPLVPSDGGWAALVPIDPDGRDRRDEDQVARALLAAGVITQPGWLFDVPGDHLVLSLLTPPAALARATPALRAVLASSG